jgi:hypothetical protein
VRVHTQYMERILRKPVLWWQVPFGVPSTTPGATARRYRDNRARYVFGHVGEFVAAGWLGSRSAWGREIRRTSRRTGGSLGVR